MTDIPKINTQKRLAILTLAATLILNGASFLSPNTAHACSCIANYTQEQAYEDAEAVFVGRVLSVDTHNGGIRSAFIGKGSHRKVEFWVTERWKGIDENAVTVATGMDSASCGFHFAEGEQYLVYATGGDFFGTDLATGICTRTEVLRHAQEDVAALGPGDTTFTDAETVYNPMEGPWWNELQNEVAEFFINPITRTVFVAPWYIALGILSLYITPFVVLTYWLYRKIKNKI